MRVALDYKDNRVQIDNTQSNLEYYCPYCGAPLITRKGEIRQHHFAHKANHLCSDSWERERTYDISDWHNEWQSQFPIENQEVKVELGETRHRADVMVGRTVIEFQHSLMPIKSFDDRNNFYFNLGYKVIWLFDLSDLYVAGQLSYTSQNNGLFFHWRNPKKAFNSYDVKCGCIDLFFQISNKNEKSIVRVMDVSEYGFENFETTDFLSQNDFFEYVGFSNGACQPPEREDISINEGYKKFKEIYNISLNKQQERALHAIDGHNLILAVPGSGKTTVLVARLGYMIIERGVNPESVLAITYNKQAAAEMKSRFSDKFGASIGERISFKTINSLALQIYKYYCRKTNQSERRLIKDKESRLLLAKIYKKYHPKEFVAENDILELKSAFAYIKNMILTKEQIKDLDTEIPLLSQMYEEYQNHLKNSKCMDFDDQLVFAEWILSHDKNNLNELRTQFKYICVDEAQDTSKIQHKIIFKIAEPNHLFMVGDEDQSIYGFRAAYPKALLNFRYDYRNPYILRMERNFRSTVQIVEKAQLFISKNKGRYEKNMTAERGNGNDVEVISTPSRETQYKLLLDVAKKHTAETAFLYRDNESAVALVDLFLRNNISFTLKKPEMNFFGNKVVKDIIAYPC